MSSGASGEPPETTMTTVMVGIVGDLDLSGWLGSKRWAPRDRRTWPFCVHAPP